MTRTVCLQDDVYFAIKLCFLSFTHFGIQFISLLRANKWGFAKVSQDQVT